MTVNRIFVLAVFTLGLLLVGCTQDQVTTATPFVGGTEGLVLSFLEGSPPAEVFDDDQFPFQVAVQVVNAGEEDIDSSDGYIEVDGILPSEYGVSKSDLRQNIPAIRGARKTANDVVLSGEIEVVSFEDLSYQQNIAGSLSSQTIRAVACYNYITRTTTNICVKEDALDSINENDICTVTEQKTVANSGGPIQITKLQETLQGRDKIQVTFEISHVGDEQDRFFKIDTDCENTNTNPDRYKVFVDVDSIVNNRISARCSGFQEGSGSSGFVLLPNGEPRTLTCSFDTGSVDGDSITPLNIELEYRYMEWLDTPITIKDVSTNVRE